MKFTVEVHVSANEEEVSHKKFLDDLFQFLEDPTEEQE